MGSHFHKKLLILAEEYLHGVLTETCYDEWTKTLTLRIQMPNGIKEEQNTPLSYRKLKSETDKEIQDFSKKLIPSDGSFLIPLDGSFPTVVSSKNKTSEDEVASVEGLTKREFRKDQEYIKIKVHATDTIKEGFTVPKEASNPYPLMFGSKLIPEPREIVSTNEDNVTCNCGLSALMVSGCKCGAFKREQHDRRG